MPLPKGRSHPVRHTRNPPLRLSRTSVTPRHLNKLARKGHLHKRVSVRVVTVVRMGAQPFAARRLVAVASHRAYSSHLAVAEMGVYHVFVYCQEV